MRSAPAATADRAGRSRTRIAPESIRSLLVVAPHPDDETIGAGGLVHAMAGLGRPVRIVVASDGRASHPGSRLYDPLSLADLRRNETLDAMHRLGLESRDVRFCDFEDGKSVDWENDRASLSRFVSAIHGRWDAVCLPSEWDGHPDHAKTRDLALRHLGPRRLDLAYTIWPREGAAKPEPDAEYVLGPRGHRAKSEAMRLYRTQMGGVPDDPAGFVIDAPLFVRFTAPVERFHLTRHLH